MPGEQTRAGIARSRRGFLKTATLGSAARRSRAGDGGGTGPERPQTGRWRERLRRALRVRDDAAPRARIALRPGRRQPDAAAGSGRRHHPVGAALRAAPRRDTRHRPVRSPTAGRRARRAAAGLLDGRPAAHAGGDPRLLRRVLRERPRQVVAGRAGHGCPGGVRHDELQRMDRGAGVRAARRGRGAGRRRVARGRGSRRLPDDAQRAPRQGARRHAGGLRPERRGAAAGPGLSATAADPRLGGQHLDQVAAPAAGGRPVVPDAGGDGEVTPT